MPAKVTLKAAAARPPIRKPVPQQQEQEQEHQETGNEGVSKADAFDTAPASALGIPPGDWEARILEMVYEKTAKGESVKVSYECTTTDEESAAFGKKSSQWYQIFDKDGKLGKGIGFLKADLEKLGCDADSMKFDVLEETLKQISDAQPLVNIKSKQNGQYLNVYLQSLVEDAG